MPYAGFRKSYVVSSDCYVGRYGNVGTSVPRDINPAVNCLLYIDEIATPGIEWNIRELSLSNSAVTVYMFGD